MPEAGMTGVAFALVGERRCGAGWSQLATTWQLSVADPHVACRQAFTVSCYRSYITFLCDRRHLIFSQFPAFQLIWTS